jgi:outer membrane receptor protein involved in Fe transport
VILVAARRWRSRCARVVAIASAPFAAAMLLTSGATAAYAQDPPCDVRLTTNAQRADRAWPAPLSRVVTMPEEVLPLRTALDNLAAGARIRLSYSPDLLPLDRRACVAAGETTLGDALTTLLAHTGISPVIAGSDQVVLAPTRAAVAAEATPEVARTTGQLERVVVTGTVTGGPERASPFALAVVDGATLRRSGPAAQLTSDILNGAVPGVWVWAQSPTSPLSRFGSIRGASSFGVSAPKVYIDGIEVANPLLLSELDASRIQRIEVIRGPQGAALYGADAISGVVNIVTRNEGVSADAPATEIMGSAGTSSSAYATSGVLVQNHAATLRTGTAARSTALGVTVSTLGAYVPDAGATRVAVQGSARAVGTRNVLTGTARLFAMDASAPVSPLLRSIGRFNSSDAEGETVREFTLGGSVTRHVSERWTHALVAGADGYRLSGVASDWTPVPSQSDSALRAARGNAIRATLRASSTVRLGGASSEGDATTVTVAMEQSSARERTNRYGTRLAPPDASEPAGDALNGALITSWWHNTGALVQAGWSLRNALFLSGGARLEHIRGPADMEQTAMLPMIGASWVTQYDVVTVKLRGAYGRGIRPVHTLTRGATWMGGHEDDAQGALAPEEQKGLESGIDLFVGQLLALHATRFDQRAFGLVQPVAVLTDTSVTADPRQEHFAYQLQNVGAIDNRGWELQGTSRAGPVTLSGTISLVDSRVATLRRGYTGDLRQGDRMLEVPSRTFGASAAWSAGTRLTLSTALSRANDWVSYDRLALAQALAQTMQSGREATRPPVGADLRAFWRVYGGVTHWNASSTYTLWPRMTLIFSGDNLLGHQRGEPDNVTVLPGRTLALGVRAGF